MILSAGDAQTLADERLEEARVLLSSSRPSGAYYLAGYAVELALKAVVARQFASDTIPDKQFVLNVYTHDLAKLLKLAGLQAALEQTDPDVQANWGVATQWSETARYAIIDADQAKDFLSAVGDDKSGVIQWLKSHW